MNSLNTLYFPGTDLYSIRQYPAFLLFQKIHLIKPVEENPADSGKEPQDSFIKSGFCQEHTPCPLRKNRDRFTRLIGDIRNRKDDYAGQLSSLILASKTGSANIDPDSEQSIMDSLIPPKDLQERSVLAAREEKLWQARLILAIGEILDQEEEEIAANLAMLDDEQTELFKELHGDSEAMDEDTPFTELLQVERNLGAAKSGNVKKRFNAWKTLFLEGEVPKCEIFLTTSVDSGDLLMELYEKKTGLTASLAASLELPGLIGRNSTEASQAVVTFCEKNGDLLARIKKDLSLLVEKTTPTKETLPGNNGFAAITEQWARQLETVFPAKQYGRVPVKFYIFPNLTCSALIGKKQPAIVPPENGLLVVIG
jgi:hypothetical protein